jgi:hypothetical protein
VILDRAGGVLSNFDPFWCCASIDDITGTPALESEPKMDEQQKERWLAQMRSIWEQKDTDELLAVWNEDDRTAWTDDTFEVIRQVLIARIGRLPPRGAGRRSDEARRPNRLTRIVLLVWNRIRSQPLKSLQLLLASAGMALMVWGSLLPWSCYYPALAFICNPGAAFNPVVFEYLNISQIVFMFCTVVVLYYLLNVNRIFKRRWQTIAVACVAGSLSFLIVAAGFIMNGGALMFIVGAIVVVGAIFHPTRQANMIARAVSLLLTLFAVYSLSAAPVPSDGFEVYGHALWQGRLLMLLGSLSLLGANLLSERLAVPPAPLSGSPRHAKLSPEVSERGSPTDAP